jgi:hypothetical protein
MASSTVDARAYSKGAGTCMTVLPLLEGDPSGTVHRFRGDSASG